MRQKNRKYKIVHFRLNIYIHMIVSTLHRGESRDHLLRRPQIFSIFDPYPPTVGSFFYYYLSANLTQFLTPSPYKLPMSKMNGPVAKERCQFRFKFINAVFRKLNGTLLECQTSWGSPVLSGIQAKYHLIYEILH